MVVRGARSAAAAVVSVLAAIGLVAALPSVLGGVLLGVFAGAGAWAWVHESSGAGIATTARAARRAGVRTFGATAAGWAACSGAVVVLGTAAWVTLVGVALLVGLVAALRWQHRGGRPRAAQVTVDAVPALSTGELCRAWRGSWLTLAETPPGPGRDEVVRHRAVLLDELERRDPDGFRRWIDTGAAAGGDPASFLTGDHSGA